MPKNLSERILSRAKQKEGKGRAQNHAAFLAQREQIKQSLADGWAVFHIWETLYREGKIKTCYAAFCRQVKRSIPPRRAAAPEVPVASGARQQRRLEAPVVDGFSFESTPNQEDLL